MLHVSTEELVAKCLASGLVIRRAPTYEVTHPPVTLQPTLITQASFDFITDLQPAWNALMDAVARDFAFLTKALHTCAASDGKFTGRLLGMLHEVYLQPPNGTAQPVVQDAMLGILRTDYMREEATRLWKNVEVNTISVSFAGLAPRVNGFHRYLQALQRAEQAAPSDDGYIDGTIVGGTSGEEVPSALAAAHQHAVNGMGGVEMEAIRTAVPVVVIVVQEKERNTGDQFALSIALLEQHGVRSIRRTMSELHRSMVLVPREGVPAPPAALIDDRYVATVFYFRCAYVPQDFVDEGCWLARRDIERSSAIKCPSIPYHLAGFKKIQQLLCDPIILGQFVPPSSSAFERLRATFMGQYSLDADEVGVEAVTHRIQDALTFPRKYVLKPQLEGGGNLLAGEALCRALQLPEDDPTFLHIRKEYILMERIAFAKTSGKILRYGEVLAFANNLCCELGIFGCILSTGKGVHPLNKFSGTLVRTKPADVDDGGVMAGVAALDSLAVVSND